MASFAERRRIRERTTALLRRRRQNAGVPLVEVTGNAHLTNLLLAGLLSALVLLLLTWGVSRRDLAGAMETNAFHLVGLTFLVLAVNATVGVYLTRYAREILATRWAFGCYLLLWVFVLAAAKAAQVLGSNPFWLPLPLVALMVSLVYDAGVAFVTATALAFFCGLIYWVPSPGELRDWSDPVNLTVFLGLLSGSTMAAYSVTRIRERNRLLAAGLHAGLAMALAILGLKLLLGGHVLAGPDWHWTAESARLFLWDSAVGLLACLASGFVIFHSLAYVEQFFGITSDVSLLDWGDLNRPFLKRFNQTAGGTYRHSLNVGDLAEAAAEAVGANPILARVGALYHDIGKMYKPEYFVENQAYGESPHPKLKPAMSTLIIISHVKDGVELAEEMGLPPKLIDFIREHHGTTLVEYFWHEALNQWKAECRRLAEAHGADAVMPVPPRESDFRYPGPKPMTKETAIVLVADSVEAVTRTLHEPTPARIETVIHDIVRKRLLDGQLDSCPLTLADTYKVEEAFKRVLLTIHHSRIKYPEPEGQK